MKFRFADLKDCSTLAELNWQLIQDEGHRNCMTVLELEQRMKHWLGTEYRAVIFEADEELLPCDLFREQPDAIYLRQFFPFAQPELSSKVPPRTARLAVPSRPIESFPAKTRAFCSIVVRESALSWNSCMKRWWLITLIALVVALALAALALQLSGSRSRSAVEEYKAQLRAAGEKLDWKELAPPPIPPDENSVDIFYQVTNLMSISIQDAVATNQPPIMHCILPGVAIISWQQPDVREYGTNSWADYEVGLAARSSLFELLHKIPERPHLQFDLDYDKGAFLLLPNLSKLKQAAQLLAAAVVCDLHEGNTASAVTNVHTSFALVNAWQDEPLLISQLVRIAMAQIAFSAQWELLQATNLTDEHLALLQRDCASMQFVGPMEHAFEGERAFGSTTIQQMRNSSSPSVMIWGSGRSSSGSGSGDWLDALKEFGETAKTKVAESLWRVSWSFADERDSLRGNQVLVEAARQIQTNDFFKGGIAEAERRLKALGLDKASGGWLREELDDSIHALLVESVSTVSATLNKFLSAAAARNISVTAIALKRYQLRHGKFPSDLNALIPEFVPSVPRDPVDGKPLRYRLNADGTFLLYSVGKDGSDDGGDASPTGSSKSLYWLNGHDLVWPRPATQQEIDAARSSRN